MTSALVPLRYAAKVLVSNVDKKANDGELPVRLVNYTDVYYQAAISPALELMAATASSEQISKFRVLPGDSIITKDSETPDDIAVATYVASADADMVCGYHLAIIRPSGGHDPKYLHWALRSDLAREQFSVRANGMTRYGLTYDAIESVELPAPPLEEQRRIADFLDDQVARIDRIIEARQQQVTELRSAIESTAWTAVTGNDMPDRGPSSVHWADSLPSGWGSPRICQVARMGTGHTPSRSEPAYWVDCDIPWLTTGDVHRFRSDEIEFVDDTVLRISQLGLANSAAVLHPRGTVALSRTASAGFSIIMDADMATSQDYATWTCGPLLNNVFLLWCLRVMRRDLMGRLATGSTHKTIYFPDLMSIRIPLPPMPAQVTAVEQIAVSVTSIRGSMRTVSASVALLQELKRSLITAAVTGEFDVSSASGVA